MHIAVGIFVILHIICWAVALGAWAVAARTKQVSVAIAHASAGAVVFGAIAMVLMLFSPNAGGDHLFYTIKLVIALATMAAAFVAKNKQENTPAAVWYAIPALIIVNVFIGYFRIGM